MGDRVFLCDLDGTLCDDTDRLRYLTEQSPPDYNLYHSLCHLDPPIPHMLELMRLINRSYPIIFPTGRMLRNYFKTECWLSGYGLWNSNRLMMRADDDYRPAVVVKGEMIDRIQSEGIEIIMAFDDHTDVVKMYRSRGIPCLQVKDGDFIDMYTGVQPTK